VSSEVGGGVSGLSSSSISSSRVVLEVSDRK
jgi:hypothetical protein